MSLKPHFLMFGLTILISSFFPVCLCSYPFPEDVIREYNTNYSTNNDIFENHENVRSYYELDLQKLASYDRLILDHARHHSHHRPHSRTQARALPPSHSPTKVINVVSHPRVFNVDHFIRSRRRRGRRRDHTKAFKKAWKMACRKGGIFLVPRNKNYRVRPIKFSGPCHPPLVIKIKGTIEASTRVRDYRDRGHWLVFENLRNFKVEGGGTIDGKGQFWWQNSCKINKTKPCLKAPTAVTFIGCKNFIVNGLMLTNSQQMHMSFQKCNAVRASNIIINSPGNSPNTDGIHVTETRNIQITRSLISTGDDCISVVSGSKHVQISDITCGPGHGISIGSLGEGNSKASVSDVLVNKARLSGTKNGLRIKTWQGGKGYAKNVVFENILMYNVSNPIIIDQNYCDQEKPCAQQQSAVHISNVVYKNIKGTSFTKEAIKFECSKSHHCRGILLQNVNLVSVKGKKLAGADCKNVVELYYRGKVIPRCFQETY